MRYIVLFFTILWSLFSSAQPSPETLPNTRAVVIGISNYQDEEVSDLKYADKAALAFGAYLKSKAGGSIPDKHIRLLINKSATAGQMVAALDWLMSAGQVGDRAIFYFAGYGNEQRLIPNDMPAPVIRSDAFPFQKIKRSLFRKAKSGAIDFITIADLYPARSR